MSANKDKVEGAVSTEGEVKDILSIEEGVRDVISQKMKDGTIEKIVTEQFEASVTSAVKSLFSSYGSVTTVVEKKLKEIIIPHLENYDFSKYIIKLDDVLKEILEGSTREHNQTLSSFKSLMFDDIGKEVTATDMFKEYCKFVAKEADSDGLEVDYEGDPDYEPVSCTFEFEEDVDRFAGNTFKWGRVKFSCAHDDDEKLAFEFRVLGNSVRKSDTEVLYHMANLPEQYISSLSTLSSFHIYLMKIKGFGSHIRIDRNYLDEDVMLDAKPEASYS